MEEYGTEGSGKLENQSVEGLEKIISREELGSGQRYDKP